MSNLHITLGRPPSQDFISFPFIMALGSVFRLCFLFYCLLLPSLTSAAGKLAFFLDEFCEQASIINPSVNVDADTCLVTPGALGIAIQAQPACPSGTATFKMFVDTSCANPVDMDIDYDNCYAHGLNGVKAIAFVCGGATITATSTTPAGSSTIPVAADTPSTSSFGAVATGQSTPPSNGASPTSNSPSSFTSTNPSHSNTNGNGTNGNSGDKSSGMSSKTQIILEVVLPVGAIVVAIFAWCFPCGSR